MNESASRNHPIPGTLALCLWKSGATPRKGLLQMQNSMMRRSGARVRRHSKEKGNCERRYWRSFDPRDRGRYMMAAERFDRHGRAAGDRNGPLGSVALEVLRELLRLVDYKSGRLDPSLDYLGKQLKRSRDAVVRALANLRRHGFLDWIRRWEPGEGDQPVKQATNAYRLFLPAAALKLLGARWQDPPPPDDAPDRAASWRDMLKGLSPAEMAAAAFGDTPLGRIAARLSRFVVKESPSGGQNPGRDSSNDE